MRSSTAAAISVGISQDGSMPLGPRMSRMSSSGPGAVPGTEPGEVAEPGVVPDPDPESDAGAEGVTRAGVSVGENVGPGARAGGGGAKISGVDGARVTGDDAESAAAAAVDAGADSGAVAAALVSAKDWLPGKTATRLMIMAALAEAARLLMRALIRGGVHGF